MKAGTTLVLAASVLLVLAVGCNKNSGSANDASEASAAKRMASKHDVDQELSGKSFTTEVDAASGQSTTVQTLEANGKPGAADVVSTVVFKTHDRKIAEQIAMNGPDPRCPAQKPDKYYPYPADIVSVSWVQSYNDGSSFTGKIAADKIPQSALCTDGARFYVKVEGSVIDGSGPRFKNVVGGTWDAEIWVDNESNATGTVRADFETPQE